MRTSLLAIVIALGCCISAVAQLDDILKKADATLQQRDTSSTARSLPGSSRLWKSAPAKPSLQPDGLMDF
jgi:hypothetical protein